MSVFDAAARHEQVVYCSDPRSGLRAIIALYSTVLGPALGGTRFYPYADEDEALTDVLRLSEAMAYKSALAGLDLGGGKAVIIGDPALDKNEALLRAYGCFIAGLAGRYITACDVGTTPSDMDVVARECAHVTGRSAAFGGAGDSSILTAFGVMQGMTAAATHLWGAPELAGRRVGVEGVGKVGSRLVDQLVEAGARVLVYDVDEAAIARVLERHPGVAAHADRTGLIADDLDIYAPCALGGALSAPVVEQLSATVVCGGANNQLAEEGMAKLLQDRGVLYAPDYLVNAGGLIQVADEIDGFDHARAKERARGIHQTARRVFALAEKQGLTPSAAAGALAEQRMDRIGAVRALRPARRNPEEIVQ